MVHAKQGGAREVHQTGEGHVGPPSMRNCNEVGCRNNRTLCSQVGLHQGSAFSPFLFAIMMESLTENIRKNTLADDVRRWCGAVRKGERRTRVGSGAVDGSLGEERNESVEGKDRVHVSEWNAISKC